MKIFDDIGVQIPTVFLPNKDINPTKWAVIACDQYTSEPDYWNQVEKIVGDKPSTLRLTLPEIYLESPNEPEMIQAIQQNMRSVLQDGTVVPHDGMVLVRRTVNGKTRTGLMIALDLEKYDFNKGSSSLIRATEGTIIERLPPRIKIREGAALEFPHILVLIDDPDHTVIEPVAKQASETDKLYDFDLMFNSGHLAGYKVNEQAEAGVIASLRKLADPQVFSNKYGLNNQPVLLFAMGDGNHSLATAKAIWQKIKDQVGPNHPARYALVEIENVHDDALEFEPIHRVIFNLKKDFMAELAGFFNRQVELTYAENAEEMEKLINQRGDGLQKVGCAFNGQYIIAKFTNPTTNLAVGTLQHFIDAFMKDAGAEKLDYVHGANVTVRLGLQPNNIGLLLPGMHKSDLFKTVIVDGALPRKTFSMGEAHEKRFYMEARKIA